MRLPPHKCIYGWRCFADIIMRTRGASGNRGKAEAARSKALQHYAAGLADDGTSRQAKDAWLQAWHISAGLLPHARYGSCQEGDEPIEALLTRFPFVSHS
jgi:hypothetical protein